MYFQRQGIIAYFHFVRYKILTYWSCPSSACICCGNLKNTAYQTANKINEISIGIKVMSVAL